MKDVKNWISNPKKDVEKGIKLYDRYGNNPNIKRFIHLSISRSSKKLMSMLECELGKIYKLYQLNSKLFPQVKKTDVVKSSSTKKASTGDKTLKNKSESFEKAVENEVVKKLAEQEKQNIKKCPELNSIIERRNLLYVEVKNIHARMAETKVKSQRKEMAKQILDLWDDIGECWESINYFKEFGKLPKPDEHVIAKEPLIKCDVNDMLSLIKRRNTVRSYISMYKKSGNDLKAKYENELAEIEKILGK